MTDNDYTNRMRMAVRTVKNPSPIPVDVIQHSDAIELRVSSSDAFKRLSFKERMSYISYLHTLADYIGSEGARVYVTGAEV